MTLWTRLFGEETPKTPDEIIQERDNLKRECADLRKTKEDLTIEVAELKHRHKLEKEDIEHLMRVRQEQLDIQHERKEVERERAKAREIQEVKDDYQDRLTERLEIEVENMKEMYGEILARLPNVTAHFGAGNANKEGG